MQLPDVIGWLGEETVKSLQAAVLRAGQSQIDKLRADVRAFLATDPVSGFAIARGIVREALERHGVNLSTLALDIVTRYLGAKE